MTGPEVDTEAALTEIVANIPLLTAWAAEQRPGSGAIAQRRLWYGPAGTYVYQTSVAAPVAGSDALEQVAEVFFNASRLQAQPWYPAFVGGRVLDKPVPSARPLRRACLSQTRFDFGLRSDRYYNQLIAEVHPDADTRIVAMRSVSGLPAVHGAAKAYTLSPSADLFQRCDTDLLWHHIVTAGGAALLPPRADRWMMNAVRALRLDRQERSTYLEEAAGFLELCQSDGWTALLRGLD